MSTTAHRCTVAKPEELILAIVNGYLLIDRSLLGVTMRVMVDANQAEVVSPCPSASSSLFSRFDDARSRRELRREKHEYSFDG